MHMEVHLPVHGTVVGAEEVFTDPAAGDSVREGTGIRIISATS